MLKTNMSFAYASSECVCDAPSCGGPFSGDASHVDKKMLQQYSADLTHPKPSQVGLKLDERASLRIADLGRAFQVKP